MLGLITTTIIFPTSVSRVCKFVIAVGENKFVCSFVLLMPR